ncbi:MAG TPA: hypothetical protein VHK26_01595 [Methyloceanibacter sp.]|nr:hypothetical protein [Methyloceanibacter sp.]
MYRRRVLGFGVVFAFFAIAAIHAASAADPTYCAKYASDAEKAASLAKKLGCGFQGPRWGMDKGPHMAWCLLVDPKLAHSETEARSADLKLCSCQQYADQTMVQVAINIAKKCGFTGLRWLDNKKAHYNWCFNANPGLKAMQNEIDIRKQMLKGC